MIYLDNAATTQPVESVAEAVREYLSAPIANPSSFYYLADDAKKIIKETKEAVAEFINCEPEQIILTSGASESNSIAIHRGLYVVTSAIEHDSILDNGEVYFTYLKVDKNGIVDPDKLDFYMNHDWYDVVSVMAVNNEIGTIQPITELAEIAHYHETCFHTDATQMFGHMPIDIKRLDCDMLSGSFEKVGGLAGTGFFYSRKPITRPLINGEQFNKQRGGTENMVGIIAAREAMNHLKKNFNEDASLMASLKTYLETGLHKIPQISINCENSLRAPHITNFRIKGIKSEEILQYLASRDIFLSAGSACTTKSAQSSHVLRNIGLTDSEASECLRCSLSASNSFYEIDILLNTIKEFIMIKEG